MTLFFKQATQDVLKNRFLSGVTIITIALSIFIVSAFALFFINANDAMNSWKKGIRIMAYLKPDISEAKLLDTRHKIQLMHEVSDVGFISKDEALLILKEQMKRQSSFFANLKENPLPDAFEIRTSASYASGEKIERLAAQIELLPSVEEVEYGRRWIGRFTYIFKLLRLAGYAMGGLFFMAAVFIVANTIRLVLYSRREEVEIMRLVGATDRFIKTPFYIEGIIQGALGSIIGLAALFTVFMFISLNVEQSFTSGFFHIRFLPLEVSCGIIMCSMFAGWSGCYLSINRFLKI